MDKGYVPPHPRQEPKYPVPITADNVKSVFQGAADFFARQVFVGGDENLPATLFFIDGLVSGSEISAYVLKPLLLCEVEGLAPHEAFSRLEDAMIYACTGDVRDTMDKVCHGLVNGFAIVVMEGVEKALAFETKTGEKRSISEPSIENTVKGSKDAFVETIRVNTSLVRRHLRTPELRITESIVGRQTLTNVSILYINKLTNEAMVQDLEKRLEQIDIDGMLSTGALEEYLFGTGHGSLFPRLIYTERTDRFCTEVMGGRIGLLVDGMPLGFLLPATMAQIMKTPEDRSENHVVASCLRGLRYLALLVTLLLPGLYLAVRSFHSEMLPPQLLQAILESKEKVASSTSFEIIALLLSFELLQEAGLRLPQNIGQTLGVIGGLVVGTAAVDASIISPAVLVVVALAGIAGYTLPNQDFSNAVRLWRFIIVLAAGVLGLFGILMACLAMLLSMCRLETFGVPYLAPFAQGDYHRALDDITVQPIKDDKYRQSELKTQNRRSRR